MFFCLGPCNYSGTQSAGKYLLPLLVGKEASMSTTQETNNVEYNNVFMVEVGS